MAETSHITRTDRLFVGEAKVLRFEVFDDDEDASPRTMEDVAGKSFIWVLRLSDNDGQPPVLRKTTTISVTGTYNAVRAQNTQRVAVPLERVDTLGLAPGVYRQTLWSADDNLVLSTGSALVQQAGDQ